ncbi:hypothetical protein JOM56_014869 [Amanita muscaria]
MSKPVATLNSGSKRPFTGSSPPENKRRREVGPQNPFLDLEAGEADDEDLEQDFDDEGEANEQGEVDERSSSSEDDKDEQEEDDERSSNPVHTPSSPSNRHDTAFDHIIARVEGHAHAPSEVRQSLSPEVLEGRAQAPSEVRQSLSPEVPDALINAFRMPAMEDPPLWRVKVHETEPHYTYDVLTQQLLKRPNWAISIISTPWCAGWIAVEAWSAETMQELCRNVSTIPQPPRVDFVLIEDRISWLYPNTGAPSKPSCPSWARIRSRSVLQEQPNVNRLLLKYAGDLALLTGIKDFPLVDIMMVPRLPVKQKSSSKQKFKRVPRLIFDDILLNDPTMESLQAIPPNTIWFPPKNYTIKWIGERGALYHIRGLRVKEAFWNSFTWFGKVHIDSLVLDKPNPMFAEINLFSWGFVMQEAPYIQGFLRHSYEIFTRAPLAVGHRVSVEPTRCAPDDILIFPDVSMPAEKVGTVTDIHFDTVSVQDLTTGLIEEIPVRDLRRMFNIGDTVKAHSPASLHHPNLEGWVVNTDEDVVTVVHGKTKEQVSVKSWQLVPIELDFIHHEKSSSSEPLPRSLRGYDPYENLVNSRVVIGGLHHEKGLRGRVREHVGHQIMRIELESGMRLVDVHINQLLSTNNSGARLRHYYVHNHEFHAVPVVDYATTETLRGPLALTLAPSTTPPRSTTPIPEDVEEVDNVWNPSYIPEGMVVEETDIIPVQAPPPTLIFKDRVLAQDWLFHAGLANQRIYVKVVNSRPSASSPGFEQGFLEGEEGMIISADQGLNAVLIHVIRSKQSQRIPLRFLWPQAPWRKGLPVVVLEGDRLGQTFVTREPTSENLFPLVPRHQSRGKASPICFLPPSALARCDAK